MKKLINNNHGHWRISTRELLMIPVALVCALPVICYRAIRDCVKKKCEKEKQKEEK